MNQELRDLLDQIDNKKQEAIQLVQNNELDKAKAMKNEIKDLQDKFDTLKDLYDNDLSHFQDNLKDGKAKNISLKDDEKDGPNDSTKGFANAARRLFRVNNQMNEGTPADGGYLVPEDIETKINHLRTAKGALQNLVTVTPVKTKSGARTYKTRQNQTGFSEVSEGAAIGKKATPQFSRLTYDVKKYAGYFPVTNETYKTRQNQTGFSEVSEGAAIGKKATPQFSRLTYDVKKYAGYFPVTNELLADSDQNITNELIQWIGDESRITRNKLILNVLDTKQKTAIDGTNDGLDAIKKIINVTLDPAFRNSAILVTNQDGFNWLDTLKDGVGRYLLEESLASPTGYRFKGLDVYMYSNKDLPNDTSAGTKAPIKRWGWSLLIRRIVGFSYGISF